MTEQSKLAHTQKVIDEIFKSALEARAKHPPKRSIELLAEIELDGCIVDHRDNKKHFCWFVLEVFGWRDRDDINIDHIETSHGDDITDSMGDNDMERIRQYILENW